MVNEEVDVRALASRFSRRGLMRGVGASGAAAAASALLAACSPSAKTSTGGGGGGSGAGDFPSTPKFKFVFVNHVTTNTFFQATQYGMADAAALVNLPKPQWTGSETSDVSQMVTAMNTAIAGHADGIAIALVDQKAFDEPVKKALAAGIPVVSYNADVPTNPRLAYIGQDLYASWRVA